MQEDKEKKVNLDPNRHKGKTWADIRDETFEGIEQVISSDKSLQERGMFFKRESNRAGDTQYHRYEDRDPNDTNPARLTGIFTQDQMDMFIQSRKDDPFYNFKEDKIDTTPIVTEDFSMSAPPAVQGVGAGGGTTMYYVRNGTIERIKV